MPARDLGSAPEADVVIAAADEDRLHARGAIDPASERPGDGEHHVLLADSRAGHRPGVFATVAGIDGDDHVAPRPWGGVRSPLAHRRLVRFAACRVDVDDQTVAVFPIGLEQKALGPHPLLHVEHHPQIVPLPVARPALGRLAMRGPDAREETIAGTGLGNTLQESGAAQIDHHPVGVAKHEQRILHGAIDVEDDPGVIRRRPRPDVLDADRGGANGQRHQASETNREGAHVRHLTGSAP